MDNSSQLTTSTPAGAEVTWSSSNSSIATVDSNGNVEGDYKEYVIHNKIDWF